MERNGFVHLQYEYVSWFVLLIVSLGSFKVLDYLCCRKQMEVSQGFIFDPKVDLNPGVVDFPAFV